MSRGNRPAPIKWTPLAHNLAGVALALFAAGTFWLVFQLFGTVCR